jgi:hypothetical protein
MLVQIGDDVWVNPSDVEMMWARDAETTAYYLRGMLANARMPLFTKWSIEKIAEQLNGK